MRVHWFQHVPFEGLGSIEHWLRGRGHQLACTRLFAGDVPLPVAQLDWLIVMGGPMNVYEEREHPWLAPEKRAIRAAIESGRRVLGICLGAQLIAAALGAKVTRNAHKEIGWFPVERVADHALFADFPPQFDAFHWHGDTFNLPVGAAHIASSEACALQAFAHGARTAALQFHLETTHASAKVLIDNAAGEIVAAPYIQSEATMTAEPARFEKLNRLMDALLARLEQA